MKLDFLKYLGGAATGNPLLKGAMGGGLLGILGGQNKAGQAPPVKPVVPGSPEAMSGLLKQFPPNMGNEQPQESLVDLPTPEAPSRPALDDNPWSKGNLAATLAGIGQGFLQTDNEPGSAFRGLGNAAASIASRPEALRAAYKANNPKTSYGGPNDQFEITEDPETGQRTVREVPEFARATADAARIKARPSVKETNDTRSRIIYAIGKMDPSKRAAAYANLYVNPTQFGLDNVEGMPTDWDEDYAAVVGGSGQTVSQSEAGYDPDRAYSRNERNDGINQGNKDRSYGLARDRFNKPPPSRRGGSASSRSGPSKGLILD